MIKDKGVVFFVFVVETRFEVGKEKGIWPGSPGPHVAGQSSGLEPPLACVLVSLTAPLGDETKKRDRTY